MLPCIESYQKVDLRTITMGVPPQEVDADGFYVIVDDDKDDGDDGHDSS